jgi:proline racemase
MDPRSAVSWTPPEDWERLVVVDAHTGGEPFRVVVSGLDEIPGDTVLDRRRYARDHLDHIRRALMWEPRGHADMYGGWIGAPTAPDSDISVLFLHNEGFSTMCGHGIIALAKVVLDTGILDATPPRSVLRIDTPAGRVIATSDHGNDGQVVSTSFENVPSFELASGHTAELPDSGTISYSIAFGGAFYALVDADEADVSLDDAPALISLGRTLKQIISEMHVLSHPDHEDLGFLYGVIFTGPARVDGAHSRNVCVFADGEVDRSPTGTGVSARLAIMYARGEIEVGEPVVVESITGSTFTGSVSETTICGPYPAVIPRIEGTAYITGRSEVWLDPNDSQGQGFLIR